MDVRSLTTALVVLFYATFCQGNLIEAGAQPAPSPPDPEPIDVIELPLPPVAPSNGVGACTESINPKGTGCITPLLGFQVFQAGSFTPDNRHIIVNVEFVGAPAFPDPASIYSGQQIILVKSGGTKFSNGDAWKCLSCGIPEQQAQGLNPETDYPQVFHSGDKVLWGHNIFDCIGALLQDDTCNPERAYIYPIRWSITPDDSGPGGKPRELRLHPDDTHLGFNAFTEDGGQISLIGRLQFDYNPATGEPRVPRYDLVDMNILINPNEKGRLYAEGSELILDQNVAAISELRGFSGSGDEVTYIGYPVESNNIDVFATHLVTGVTRRLTSHPGYVDPVAFSRDDKWMAVMDNRESDRQMWLAGIRDIPPVIDIATSIVAAATRNNGVRRFFQPILLDRYGDRGQYFGQLINAAGNWTDGAVNDPNWNGRADPAFSPDGTKIAYWQSLVVSPDCGGTNPLLCPVSTAQGGRHYRLMLASLESREAALPSGVYQIPDKIPWASPYEPGGSIPSRPSLDPGIYTLKGKESGSVEVSLESDDEGVVITVSTNYTNYSSDGKRILNGYEVVTSTAIEPGPWSTKVEWVSDLVQTGFDQATRKSSPDGFSIAIKVGENKVNATGVMETTVNGIVYTQPANGT